MCDPSRRRTALDGQAVQPAADARSARVAAPGASARRPGVSRLVPLLRWFSLVELALTTAAAVLEPAEQRGLVFARTHCALCHAIGRQGASPLAMAPTFRTLHRRYAVEDLAESLGEGIMTGNPTMPEWRLDPGQVGNLIACLRTLER